LRPNVRNIEIIWLLRSLKPDFKTIADFRSDNRAALKKVFQDFVMLCRRLDLFGRELLAVDGTRIKAVNNKDRTIIPGAMPPRMGALAAVISIRSGAGWRDWHIAFGSRSPDARGWALRPAQGKLGIVRARVAPRWKARVRTH
jgi:hypothetical protein